MKVRRFNEFGMQQFEAYLRSLASDPRRPPPRDLLESPRATHGVEAADAEAEARAAAFASKYEAGVELVRCLEPLPGEVVRRDVTLWAWLTLFHFDQVCPPDGHGRRQRKAVPRYLPQPGSSFNGLRNHLLFFPWRMVRLHGEAARYILSGELRTDANITREWATRQYQALNGVAVELGRRLYWDPDKAQLRRGATNVVRDDRGRYRRPGNLRRYLEVLLQLELTYDLHGMTAEELASLLPPREFAGWLAAGETAR